VNAVSSSSAIPLSPTVQSSFSPTYTQDYVVDETPYPEESDQRSSIMTVVPDRQLELVRHYMVNVLKIQYMQADQSIGPFIYQMIERSTSARDAVCLLSSLHRHCVRDNYAVQLSGGATALISSANDTDTFYYRLKSSLLHKGGSYDEGEAMAGLHVVSSFLFSGGRGDWDAYLNVAAKYVQSVFEDQRYYGPADALRNCPDTTRFIIKTTSASPPFLFIWRLVHAANRILSFPANSVVRRPGVSDSDARSEVFGDLPNRVRSQTRRIYRFSAVSGTVDDTHHGMRKPHLACDRGDLRTLPLEGDADAHGMFVDAEAGPTRDGNRTEVSATDLQRNVPAGSLSDASYWFSLR